MKKIVIGGLLIYCSIIAVLGWIWSSKEHMTNETYEQSDVYYMPETEYMSYTILFNHMMRDDDISSLTTLEKNAQLIVKATLKDRIFIGNGVINVCDISSIYQGDYTEQTILIYDFVPFWDVGVDYFEGAVPLQVDEEYLMFLNPAPNPSRKDTYIFASIAYGHFRLRENIRYDVAYDLENVKKVQELSTYDLVCFDDRKLPVFMKLHDQVYRKYK